jgi:transcription-repair coupling factor (superfamily II helicase)
MVSSFLYHILGIFFLFSNAYRLPKPQASYQGELIRLYDVNRYSSTSYSYSSTTRKSTSTSSTVSALITNPLEAKIEINAQRWILPGDYIVHNELGVGKYLGIRVINLTPARQSAFLEPTVVIKFADAEVAWLKRFVKTELWLYRSEDLSFGIRNVTKSSTKTEINSILDLKKWNKRRARAQEDSKSIALNLIRQAALRNSFHRIPYLPDSENSRYGEFEQAFIFTPTADQISAFEV